ncbi:MAG TPA: serine/threonine-protein kinase [Polyangiaceae bacterium]|nr:serine/threonine-protein kinase [Polyangiaceae bacterium]
MDALEATGNETKSQENTACDGDTLPRRFERYTLLKRIARGGMGEVFLATAGGIEGAERPCVVKTIRREHEEDRSFLARFLDEARIQSQLQHPGVAQIMEATNDCAGKPYVVVEFIEGRNLGDVRARAGQLGMRMGWAESLAVSIVMADALAHVHERTDAGGKPLDIVHRDLSPQNVMVSYAGDVKLIDFGTARGQNRRCQTIAGIVFAKPGYVAPEVANNTPGGIPADLYALGIMLWEMLAGRRFLAGDPAQHMALVAAGKRNPTELAALIGAPKELDALVAKLTAVSVEERYSSARQVMNDLVRLLQRAPSMADGDRSVRGRIAQLMQKLYPAEPARTRVEFSRLVAQARATDVPAPAPAPVIPPSPVAPVVEVDPTLLPGTRYRLVRVIGRGAMGVVHEALHLDLMRSVALKVLDPERMGVDAERRFKVEARAIAQLEHENLVKLFEFGVAQDGRPFYAMELLSGESLDQKLEREKGMDYREAIAIAVQACRALETAHAASVIHRDIKPANLFLSSDGKVKLLDFGVAKAAFNVESDGEGLSIVGTPEYMAPEQARGEADQRSDVYALGVVLFELLSGRLPHAAESPVLLLDAKFRKEPESLRKLAPERGIPKMVDVAVSRALSTEPEHRYKSAAELRAALEAALDEPQTSVPSRRKWVARGLASAVALGVMGVIAVGASRPEIREKAVASLNPVIEKVQAFRARAAERAHGTETAAVTAAPAQAPALAMQPAAEVALAAQDEVVAEPAPGTGVATATPVIDADVPTTNEDGEIDDDPTHAIAEKVALADVKGEDAKGEADSSSGSAAALAQAQELTAKGNELKALNVLRRAAKNSPNDVKLLEALAAAAEKDRAWGEAVRTVRHLVEVEPSLESKLQLARLERKTGHRERALQLVRSVLADNPDSPEARGMLGHLGGTDRVALQK